MNFALITVFAVLISANASARSVQLDQVCGTVHIERIVCVTAPCLNLIYLRTGNGSLSISREASSANALTVIGNSEGRAICVSGLYQDVNKSSFGAFEIVDAVTPGYVCKRTVNCMPIVSEENQKYCTNDYIEWSKQNCGAAPQVLD